MLTCLRPFACAIADAVYPERRRAENDRAKICADMSSSWATVLRIRSSFSCVHTNL